MARSRRFRPQRRLSSGKHAARWTLISDTISSRYRRQIRRQLDLVSDQNGMPRVRSALVEPCQCRIFAYHKSNPCPTIPVAINSLPSRECDDITPPHKFLIEGQRLAPCRTRNSLGSNGAPSHSPSSSCVVPPNRSGSSGGSSSSQSSKPDKNSRAPDHTRRQPRIQVSSLLASSHARRYILEVVQQPQRGAEFQNASLSRLPITPPVIARLTVVDNSGNPVVPEDELPFLVAHLSLYNEDGQSRLDEGSSMGHRQPPILYGNLVSAIDQLEDLQGNMGLFFLFPDVSIRQRGRFQLCITLLRISIFSPDSSVILGVSQQGIALTEVRTQPFDVMSQHQYTAVGVTRLTQSFIRQGARMFTFMSHP